MEIHYIYYFVVVADVCMYGVGDQIHVLVHARQET